MPISSEEKDLLQLVAKYTAITTYKDNGIIDIDTYSKILWDNLSRDEMERIKLYMEYLNGHHVEMKDFYDKFLKDSN